MEDVVHVYNRISLSHKKNETMPCAATWMDLAVITLSEAEKDKYRMRSLTGGIYSLAQMNLSMKQKQMSRQKQQT